MGELPEQLARYYETLDGGDLAGAAACFTDDAIYAIPPAGPPETGPRTVRRGRAELMGHLQRRGVKTHRHEVHLCLGNGDGEGREGWAMVEGSVVAAGGEPVASFAASACLAQDGRVARYVAHRVDPPLARGLVDRSGLVAATPLANLTRLVEVVDGAEPASVVAPGAFVSWPEPRGTRSDDAAAGLASIARSGVLGPAWRTTAGAELGGHGLVEGVAEDDGLSTGWLVSVQVDDEGRIDRLVAFATTPTV